MIYLVHGDDVSKSRALILNQQKKLNPQKRIEVDIIQTKPEELYNYIFSDTLFGDKPFIVLDISKSKSSNSENYIKILKDTPLETNVIIYSSKTLTKTNPFLKTFSDKSLSTSYKEILSEIKLQGNVYEFLDSLFTKNRRSTYINLKKIMENGENEFEIFSKILYQLRNICGIKYSSDIISKTHPFVLSKSKSQASKFSSESIKDIYSYLYELDKSSKSTSLNPNLMLTLAIEKVLNS